VLSGDEISFLKREVRKKNYDDMSITLGDNRPSYSTVKNGVAMFRTGHLNTEDVERSRRPTQVTIPKNVHSVTLNDKKISAKKIP
jgi:hypothetical protein